MSDKPKECILCDYWYFLDKNFSYGPYLCDGCYSIMQKLKKVRIEFIFCTWVSVKQKN